MYDLQESHTNVFVWNNKHSANILVRLSPKFPRCSLSSFTFESVTLYFFQCPVLYTWTVILFFPQFIHTGWPLSQSEGNSEYLSVVGGFSSNSFLQERISNLRWHGSLHLFRLLTLHAFSGALTAQHSWMEGWCGCKGRWRQAWRHFLCLVPQTVFMLSPSVRCVVFTADEVRNLLGGRQACWNILMLLGFEHAKGKPKQNKYDSCENRND